MVLHGIGQLRRSFCFSSCLSSGTAQKDAALIGWSRGMPIGDTRVQAERTYRTIFGNQEAHQVSLEGRVGNDDGGPRLLSPYFPSCNGREFQQLPLMLYLPGIDGTALGAQQQLERLSMGFELEVYLIPFKDRSSFQELLNIFTGYVRDVVGPQSTSRMVYVMGESFGSLLALAAARECPDIIDRVVLINPATSFASSAWFNAAQLLPSIPKEFYGALFALLAPLLMHPLDVLRRGVDTSASISEQASQMIEGGMNMLGTLEFVKDSVDADIMRSKLSVIVQGIKHVDDYLHKVLQRTLVIASENDRLLPSASEAGRLKDLMLRALIKILPGRSHAFMEDTDIDLLQLLKDEGFYTTKRVMSSTDGTNGKPLPKNRFGEALPIELPLKKEIEEVEKLVASSLQLSSPVFLSTMPDGRIVSGLEGIPDTRPLMFIGNHTLMALDMNVLVHRLLKDKGFLVRGLAHPAVMMEGVNILKPDGEMDLGIFGTVLFSIFNPRTQYRLYTTFGAVVVSPKNMYRLLSEGERVLLYPGGALEALKYRDQKYEVMWPDRPEFVRMGAKFGATVVTIASVGVEDGMHQLFDIREMKNSPFIGPSLEKLAESQPKARPGRMTIEKANEEILAPPLLMPKKPSRQYFLFGAPVQLTPDLVHDSEKSTELYNKFKTELETNISYLIEKREDDPYKEFEKRILYEAVNRKQAPTFIPSPINNPF